MTSHPVRHAGRLAAAWTLAAVLAAGCATTYDATDATVPANSTTTTTIPSGAAAQLLPRLVTEATSLSGTMIASGDVAGQLQRIQALWDAVRPEVGRTRPELLGDFLANIDRIRRGVQFRRAADADRGAKNLTQLVKAFLGS
jgi:hypothetical protein